MTSEFLPMNAFQEYTILPKFEEYFRKNRVNASAEAVSGASKADLGSSVPPLLGRQDGNLILSLVGNKLEESVDNRPAIKRDSVSTTGVAQGNASTNAGCSGEVSMHKLESSSSFAISTQFAQHGQGTLQKGISQAATGMVHDDTMRTFRGNQPQTCPPTFRPQNMLFPRFSSLSKQEHHTYMEWYIESLGKDIKNERNTALLQRLQNIVIQEQIEVQAFLQNRALINPIAFNYIPEELHSKLKAEMLLHVDHIKQCYKNSFVLFGVHNFPQIPARVKGTVMKYIKTLLIKATVPVLRHVSPEESMSLMGNFKILPDLVDQEVILSKRDIIQDLMKKHNAQVYVPLRTLLALVDNHPPHFGQEWIVPFSSYSKDKGGIIFNEPLSGVPMNLRSVYGTYGRSAMFQSCSSYMKKEVGHILSTRFKESVTDHSDTEKSSIYSKRTRSDDLGLGTETLDCAKNEKLSWPSVHRTCVSSEELLEQVAKETLFFDVWDLGGIKVLVQVSRNDNILCQDPGSPNHISLVLPYAKIEMQISHGLEQFSVSELCQLWWKMFLCQPSQTYCCRVDPKTGNIHNSRFYTMSDLTGPGSPFNPILSNKGLHSLLQSVIGLPDGDFLLKHDYGSSIAGIYKAAAEDPIPGEAAFRLDEDIQRISEGNWPINLNRVEWLPLDPCIPLNQNIWEMHAPCTFPIPPDPLNGNGAKRQGSKTLGSKKNKAKKKRQREHLHVVPDEPDITFF